MRSLMPGQACGAARSRIPAPSWQQSGEHRADSLYSPVAAATSVVRQGRDYMRFKRPTIIVLAITIWQLAGSPAPAQDTRKYIAPQDQVIVIRAGHLFDARAGKMLDNQLISIKGDRIGAIGPDA